jgi:hypothetical protein
MIRLYHHEYLTGECSTLPVIFFVESLMNDSASNGLIPFDTSLRTMLDEIMMWCVTAHLPEDLVRFLLSLLPNFDFKVMNKFKNFSFYFMIFVYYLAFIYRNIFTFLWCYSSITCG